MKTHQALGCDEQDWILEHAKSQQRTKVLQKAAELEDHLRKIREQERRHYSHEARYEKPEPVSKKIVSVLICIMWFER